jgi:hypothetical protein
MMRCRGATPSAAFPYAATRWSNACVATPRHVSRPATEPGKRRMSTESSPQTPERAAKNQARFRVYNERIEPHNAAHVWDPPYADWVCECADEGCLKPVGLTVAEYESVRAHPNRFLVAPSDDHVFADVERVLARHERYWVVEKQGDAADVTESLDQRRRDEASREVEVGAHADHVAWNVPMPKPQ